MSTATTIRQAILEWDDYRDNVLSGSFVDKTESPLAKSARIQRLEAHPEEWFAYYFPKYYSSAPAPFHVKSSQRILTHPEWFEVRSWSRDLAKSTRTMMEVLYLTLTGKKHNAILASYSFENAVELLTPYRIELENNERIIHDYGTQQGLDTWTNWKFKTTKKVAFRAIGKGQSPRGTRNEQYRPDVILIDDMDTDEEVRNTQRVKEGINWIEQSLIGTRSTSSSQPLLVLVCGNIIAPYCTVTELSKRADHHDIVNILDTSGASSWEGKVSMETIERIRSTISERSFQQEYMNNPTPEGVVFKEVVYKKLPPIEQCSAVIIYADPATSNSEAKQSSMKAVGIIGQLKQDFFLYKIWLDNMTNDLFVECLFSAYQYAKSCDTTKVFVENNTLQNPFYEQVLLPIIRKKSKEKNITLPITPDTRKKSEKFTRIEATLEPVSRLSHLFFNADEQNDPHMKRMHFQMLAVSPTTKMMDGPDMLEGAVWIAQKRNYADGHTYIAQKTPNRKY